MPDWASGETVPDPDGGQWVLDCFSSRYARHTHDQTCYRWESGADG